MKGKDIEGFVSKLNKIIVIFALVAVLACCFALFVGCGDKGGGNGGSEKLPFDRASESADGYATVYIPDDRDFKILVLSDPQIDTSQKYTLVGSLGNDKTYEFIEDFVGQCAPDLVVINGDMVMNDTLATSAPYFKRYGEIFDRIKVPWTFTFGNHDLDGTYTDEEADMEDPDCGQCTKQTLIDYFNANYKYCLINTDSSCEDGTGNHFINVRKKSGELVYTLCLFDCIYKGGNPNYNAVPTANQVNWYKDTILKISDNEFGKDREEGEVVKSMIFNHVGIPEFKEAWQKAWNNGNPTEDYHYGHWFEGNYSKKYGDMPEDEQIFAVAKNLKSTTAIFMCHHHDNDFSVDYEGIRLTFGQHSGFAHNYRTQQTFADGVFGFVDKTDLKNWLSISFERIDDYGDERGGTTVTISKEGTFDISQTIAREVMPDYFDKYYIDYDAVAQSLNGDSRFIGTVERGTARKWKKA